MKIIPVLLLTLLSACANGKGKSFTGSTPASPVIRSFLGMSMSDSVDFIRWKITIQDDNYQLSCNYGIGKPNTNGFYEGGKWVRLNGPLREEMNYIWLQNGNKTLGLAKLNTSLWHLVDAGRSLLAGTAGWSYTLNIVSTFPVSDDFRFISKQAVLADSMSFHGRTPCLEFADIRKNNNCYKLKWSLTLYADAKTNTPTRYRLKGTAVQHNERTGSWTGEWGLNTDKDGKIIYRLGLDSGEPLYFLLLENILVITDKQGKMMVGNEDFSYTLSRK